MNSRARQIVVLCSPNQLHFKVKLLVKSLSFFSFQSRLHRSNEECCNAKILNTRASKLMEINEIKLEF